MARSWRQHLAAIDFAAERLGQCADGVAWRSALLLNGKLAGRRCYDDRQSLIKTGSNCRTRLPRRRRAARRCRRRTSHPTRSKWGRGTLPNFLVGISVSAELHDRLAGTRAFRARLAYAAQDRRPPADRRPTMS